VWIWVVGYRGLRRHTQPLGHHYQKITGWDKVTSVSVAGIVGDGDAGKRGTAAASGLRVQGLQGLGQRGSGTSLDPKCTTSLVESKGLE
jgi:hypothetical protein